MPARLLRRPAQPPLDVPFTLNRGSMQAVGLAGWWPVLAARSAGTLQDMIGRHPMTPSSELSIVGDAAFGAVLDWGTAKGSAKCSFSGFSDLATNVTTFVCWVKIRTYDSFGVVLFGTNTGNSVYWQIPSDAEVYIMAQQLTITPFNFDDSTWHHIAMVSDGSNIRLYIDGVLNTSSAVAGTALASGSKSFELGKWMGGTDWTLDGQMGDIRLYNRPLSAAEVWQLWATETRWELYLPQRRRLWVVEAAAPSTGPPVGSLALLGVGR